MPYRVTDTHALAVVKDIIKAEILRYDGLARPWSPQALHASLLDKGIAIPVPTIRQALDSLVTDGICQEVP